MRTYDVSPRYRSSVGFDRLLNVSTRAERVEPSTAWPPYNIERAGDDQYRITMAVAGFTPDEIELTQHDTSLLVSGQRKGQDGGRQYLHRGIAARTFHQSFDLAEHVKVTGASLENGLLTVELKREVPEAPEAPPHPHRRCWPTGGRRAGQRARPDRAGRQGRLSSTKFGQRGPSRALRFAREVAGLPAC